MSPINLRVPPNSSKNIDDLKRKIISRERNDLSRSSISLRIPNRSFASISDITSTYTTITTPTETPVKEEKSPRSTKKRRISKKIMKNVSFKSMHNQKIKKSDVKLKPN